MSVRDVFIVCASLAVGFFFGAASELKATCHRCEMEQTCPHAADAAYLASLDLGIIHDLDAQ